MGGPIGGPIGGPSQAGSFPFFGREGRRWSKNRRKLQRCSNRFAKTAVKWRFNQSCSFFEGLQYKVKSPEKTYA